jgi:hypothetical protein
MRILEHTTLRPRPQILEWAIAATMPLGVHSRFGSKQLTSDSGQERFGSYQLARGDSVTKAANRPVLCLLHDTGTRDGETPRMELENRGL